MSDEEKAERRTLIANNKAWTSAETVRREWLTQLLSRKTLSKDAGRVIAQGLTVHHRDVGTAVGSGNTLAHILLGIDRGTYWEADRLAAHLEHSPARAQHVALAVTLAGIEDSTSKNTWHHPDPGKAAYLTQLAAWGYTLSDVERIVADHQPGTRPEPDPGTAPASDHDGPDTED
jgi:ParB family chromosome partitioning protein